MSKPIPAPAIIDGVEWNVRDSGNPQVAYVDFTSKTFVVPLDCGPSGDLLRNHEMAHVQITPRDAATVERLAKEFPNRTLQAVEDCRVHIALKNAGIDTAAEVWPDADIATVAAMGDSPDEREEKLRCLLAKKGTGDYSRLAAALPPDLVELADELYRDTFGPTADAGRLPTFEDTVRLARAVHAAVGASQKEEEEKTPGGSGEAENGEEEATPSQGNSGKSGEEDNQSEAGDSSSDGEESGNAGEDITRPFAPGDLANNSGPPALEADDMTPEEREEIEEALGKKILTHLEKDYQRADGVPVKDSAMTILTPKLSASHRGKGFGNKTVASDSGYIPRRINRMASDGQVFARKIKSGYATVLIDISGSMSLTLPEIDAMIDALPHCTIAVYSGRQGMPSNGELVIVARDGKRIADIGEIRKLGGNVIDVQAMNWLARQRGPRFWISDGLVTGRHGSVLSVSHCIRLARVCRLNRIRRFLTPEELRAGLKTPNRDSQSTVNA